MDTINEWGRKLPVTEIEGIKFYVDAINREFIYTGDHSKRIYIGATIPLDDHHEFLLDKQQCCGWMGDGWPEVSDRYEWTWTRRIESLDPEGMRILAAQGKIDMFDPKDMEATVDIYGTKFFTSNRKKVLFRELDNPWNIIYTSDCHFHNEDSEHCFFYDVHKKMPLFTHEVARLEIARSFPPHIRLVDADALYKQLKQPEKHKNVRKMLDKPGRLKLS